MACLVLPLELGILIGIGINVIFILYHSARPKISIEEYSVGVADQGCGQFRIRVARSSCPNFFIPLQTSTGGTKYLMITPDRCLIFPSVDYVRNIVNKQGMKSNIPVVIDCSHIYGADYTAATAIDTMIKDFRTRQQRIYFYNLKPSILHVFEGVHNDVNVYYDSVSLENAINQK